MIVANGKKGALILQGLSAGGLYGALTAASVTSLSGDNLPGIGNVPAPTISTLINPVPATPSITAYTIGGFPVYLFVGLIVILLARK